MAPMPGRAANKPMKLTVAYGARSLWSINTGHRRTPREKTTGIEGG
jgi:hypothetical protein